MEMLQKPQVRFHSAINELNPVAPRIIVKGFTGTSYYRVSRVGCFLLETTGYAKA